MADTDREWIPLAVPEFRGNEWPYVKECLDTGWVSTAGSFVNRFEERFAAYVGAKRAVAVASGTAALHVALRLVGVEPGDEVVTSALTFTAPANAARYLGALPLFVDAEPSYWQLDVGKVRHFFRTACDFSGGVLTNRETGRRIRALLPVHILGHPVDLEALAALAGEYRLPIVEDATESLGAEHRQRRLGGHGHVACFSFNGNKIMTTGAGGMIVTDEPALADRALYLTTQAKDDPVEYVHREVGYNYRLSNLHAALGCAQLEKLDEYLAARRAIADRYRAAFGSLRGVEFMAEAPWARSIFWLSTIRIDRDAFGMDSRALMHRLAAERIQARPLWQPMHLSPAQVGAPVIDGACPVAEVLHRDCLSLPSSVGLTPVLQDRVCHAISQASRL